MNPYKKVLVALALSEQSDKKLLKKIEECTQQGAEVYVIHVVEHLSAYGAAYGIGAGIDIDEILIKSATETLDNVIKPYGIPQSHRIITSGSAAFLIVEESLRIGADLIITGSHGRHGVRLLLGSTANGILHAAQCDVLAVRIF